MSGDDMQMLNDTTLTEIKNKKYNEEEEKDFFLPIERRSFSVFVMRHSNKYIQKMWKTNTYIGCSRPRFAGILATQRWQDMFGEYPKT